MVADRATVIDPQQPSAESPEDAQAYAVSRAVNSVKNDTEQCIEPVAD
jgi:putative SOS response-associated peptidase YedK